MNIDVVALGCDLHCPMDTWFVGDPCRQYQIKVVLGAQVDVGIEFDTQWLNHFYLRMSLDQSTYFDLQVQLGLSEASCCNVEGIGRMGIMLQYFIVAFPDEFEWANGQCEIVIILQLEFGDHPKGRFNMHLFLFQTDF